MIENYVCEKYKSKTDCSTCDGFGRNKDWKVKTEDCYYSKIQSGKDLDSVVQTFAQQPIKGNK